MTVGPADYPFELLPTRPDDGFAAYNFEGFTKLQLELMERFRVVAIDYPMAHGNLSGGEGQYSGPADPGVEYHETGIPSMENLLTQYDLPIVISVPRGWSSEPVTTGADETTIEVSVSAWVENYERIYGMTEAGVIISNLVNNVENNRALSLPEPHPEYGTDPLAREVRFTNADFDVRQNAGPENVFLSWCTADFEITVKRAVGR